MSPQKPSFSHFEGEIQGLAEAKVCAFHPEPLWWQPLCQMDLR
jgi:hypothetical protein